MKHLYALVPVTCPECDSDQISLTCTNVKGNIRNRYKRCKDCGHKFKTEQLITEEKIVAKKRGGFANNAKLQPEDVQFIKAQLNGGMYSGADLALQYDVGVSAISKINRGVNWKSVPAVS